MHVYDDDLTLFISLGLFLFTGRLSSDLRHQVLKGPDVPTLSAEEREEFQLGVQEFRDHLQSLSSELSTATNTYLNLLSCLCLCN